MQKYKHRIESVDVKQYLLWKHSLKRFFLFKKGFSRSVKFRKCKENTSQCVCALPAFKSTKLMVMEAEINGKTNHIRTLSGDFVSMTSYCTINNDAKSVGKKTTKHLCTLKYDCYWINYRFMIWPEFHDLLHFQFKCQMAAPSQTRIISCIVEAVLRWISIHRKTVRVSKSNKLS